MALPGFDESTQMLLQNARVLVAGAGGLGCPCAQYLVAAGIGTVGIADADIVSESNLHRQILYGPEDFGKKKVSIACERLQKQNPGIDIVSHDVRITPQNVMELIAGYDIIVDCTDNFDTRYLLNDAGVLTGKPVVYGAIYQFEGQVAVWNVTDENDDQSPNYRDLFPKIDASQIPNCAEGGVIPTLAGIIGCMQANEVIKYITKTDGLLTGKILIFDAQSMQSRIIKIGNKTNTHITRLAETVVTPIISADDLKKAIAENAVRLIDVRTEVERMEFNIGGEHIPVEEIYQNPGKFNSTDLTVFYCASGKRSGEAVRMIRKRFPNANIYSLEGGIDRGF